MQMLSQKLKAEYCVGCCNVGVEDCILLAKWTAHESADEAYGMLFEVKWRDKDSDGEAFLNRDLYPRLHDFNCA